MAKYMLLVQTNAAEGRDDEFNKWYDDVHVKEVLAMVDGFEAAQRFEVVGGTVMGEGAHKYVALYEIETDDPEACMEAVNKAVNSGRMQMSDALDRASVAACLIRPITGRVRAS